MPPHFHLSALPGNAPGASRPARLPHGQGLALCQVLGQTICLALCLALGLTACTPRPGGKAATAERGRTAPVALPRADPGYVQWLERQAMLGAAPALAAQVSGTERIWSNSATARRLPLLLGAAPNWLAVNPYSVSAGQPLFRALGDPGLTEFMVQAGLNGLFLAPTGERADIWNKPAPAEPGGDNVAALHFDPSLGVEADFEKLAARLDQSNIQLGGELPPAATGLGPDFILQARHASRFDGLYAMMAVPQKDWDVLPNVPEEWDCLPLRAEAVASLKERGLLPQALARDSLAWATVGGWAATGQVCGADGQMRRWVYRYSGHAQRPVLLWQDPSGQARRIFSAAVIRHTGLQQQPLAGLRLEALMGLDVPAEAGAAKTDAHSGRGFPLSAALTPGLDALDEAGREIHRYGGWAMQDDIIPPSLTAAVLGTAVDFSRDGGTAAGATYALLSGDAAPLTALLRAAQTAGVDQSRLARGLHEWQGVDWRPLLDLPQGPDLVRQAQELAGASPEDNFLWASPAEVALRALRRNASKPEAAPNHKAKGAAPVAARADASLPGQGLKTEEQRALSTATLLLLSWRLGLPGLSFISPQDLSGALNIPTSAGPATSRALSLGLTPLWDENLAALSRQSAAAAPLAFGPLARQWAEPQSFARRLAALLQARRTAALAQGTLLAVVPGAAGCLAVVSSLPQGGAWLLASNFSSQKHVWHLSLPTAAHAAREAANTAEADTAPPTLAEGGRRLSLDLPPHSARHILLDRRQP